MTVFSFSTREASIVEAYKQVLTGDKDHKQLAEAYPLFLKLMRFKYEVLHKAIIYLNRYLVSTIVDDANLAILTQNLEVYLTQKNNDFISWKKARDIINSLLENENIFYQSIVRDRNIVASRYTRNFNDDDTRFQAILESADIDDGQNPIFVDFLNAIQQPAVLDPEPELEQAEQKDENP